MEDSRPTLSRRSEPSIFTFPDTGQPVRTVTFDTNPWWVAADVCTVLDHTNPTMAVASLDDDEKGLSIVETPGGPQQLVVVNEPGLYSLILRSRKPQARAFKRWITHEVIPSVRRTGSYSVAPAAPDLSTPHGVLAMAEIFQSTARELVAATEQIAELEPKVDAFDTYLSADDTDMLLRTAAKLLGTGERALRKHLLDAGFIFWTRNHTACGRAQYEPYAAHQGNGLFSLKKITVTHETFGDCNHQTVYVTPKGLEAVRRSITKHVTALVAIEGGAL